MEIDMDSKIEAKKNKKTSSLVEPRRFTGQKNILACLTKVEKCTKKETFFKKFSLSKTFALISNFDYYFFKFLKTKITSCQTVLDFS